MIGDRLGLSGELGIKSPEVTCKPYLEVIPIREVGL